MLEIDPLEPDVVPVNPVDPEPPVVDPVEPEEPVDPGNGGGQEKPTSNLGFEPEVCPNLKS